MEEDARSGDAGRVSDEVAGGAEREGRSSGRADRGEVGRDGGVEGERSDGVDAADEYGHGSGTGNPDEGLSDFPDFGDFDPDHPRNAGELSVAYILDHWEDALRIVPSGQNLSAIVGYGGIPGNADASLRELARLHQAGRYQKKIEDFLVYAADPRYPDAYRDFREGNYAAYLHEEAKEEDAPAAETDGTETPPISDREEETASIPVENAVKNAAGNAESDAAEVAKTETSPASGQEAANASAEEAASVHEYKYYMNHRPLDIGAQPSGFTRFDEEDVGGRYGAIYYDHPLSEQEIRDYELTEAEEIRSSGIKGIKVERLGDDRLSVDYDSVPQSESKRFNEEQERQPQSVDELTEEYVRSHWEEALRMAQDVSEISSIVHWGLTSNDLAQLARLHQESEPRSEIREKIEEFLDDCNFHGESDDFVFGNYDVYLSGDPEKYIRDHWEEAFQMVPEGGNLHAYLGDGFALTHDDLTELARLHQSGKDQEKIEDFLEMYDHHEDAEAFKQGRYEQFLTAEQSETAPAAEESTAETPSVDVEEVPERQRSRTQDETVPPLIAEDGIVPRIDLSTLDFSADLSTTRGKRAVFRRNLAAIQIIHRLDGTEAQPTEEEKRVLASYEGWGGLSEVFDARDPAWREEYDALRRELAQSEYESARESTLNAHYTPESIVHGMYDALHRLGFHDGNILDPAMGTGRFVSAMPSEMRENSHLFGVELDAVSAKISSYLHTDMEVAHQGFETTNFPDNAFDLAITNVPFGDYNVEDSKHKGLSVHNYFTTKMLDEVRPGGLVAVVASSYLMDQKDPSVRRELARRADLVSAVRLPNTAFAADDTEAVADILILKKLEQERSADELDRCFWIGATSKNVLDDKGGSHEGSINLYYNFHPEQVLGKLMSQSSAYGYQLTVAEDPEHPLSRDAIAETLANQEALALGYQPLDEPLPIPQQAKVVDKKNPSGYYLQDRELLYQNVKGEMEPVSFGKDEKAQVTAAITVRDAIRTMYDAELRDCSDEELAKYQEKLMTAYQDYTKSYGRVNEMKRKFKKIFKEDSAYTLLLSLEKYDDGDFEGLSDVFTKRTIHAYRAPDHADTAEEALMISMQERGKVDLPYMAQLTGTPAEKLVDTLEFSMMYEDMQEKRFVTADEYLSGNVRDKMTYLKRTLREWKNELRSLVVSSEYPPMKSIYCPFIPDYELDEFKTLHPSEPYRTLQTDFQKKMYVNLVAHNDAVFNDLFAFQQLSEDGVQKLLQPDNINILVQFLDNHSLDTLFKNPYLARYQTNPRFFLALLRNGASGAMMTPSISAHYPGCEFLREVVCGMHGNHYYPPFFRNNLTNRTLSGVRAAFLEQKIKEYEAGAFAGGYSEDQFRKEFHSFLDEAEQHIQDTMEKSDDPVIVDLRRDIARCEKNMDALAKVMPKDLTKDEVAINLGATWIDPSIIYRFMRETFHLNAYVAERIKVHFSPITCEWGIEGKVKESSSAFLTEKFGLPEKNALFLTEAALNQRSVKIMKEVTINGEDKKVQDRERTLLANAKIEAIRDAFSKWLAKNPEIQDRLIRFYNEKFNSIVPRSYDGSKLHFPGMNPEIELKPHQKNAVARTLFGGNTLLAHVVGAGKTFEMQASAMEAKRIGLAKKSMMIMPGHLTEQFGAEFLRLYPSARVLVATESDYKNADTRRLFAARVANEDWDAVVMSYEQFEKVPLSDERQIKFLNDELELALNGLKEQKIDTDHWSVKKTERYVKKLKERLEKLKDAAKRADDGITFEQLGIDRLYVDESHYYKNLAFQTHMEGFNTEHVQKTADLLGKIQYLNELTNERGVVFASGTPISNSMAELYTLQRYLKPSRLKERGITMFDSWASTFGRPVTQMELSPDGETFQAKTRFSKFQNLPELMSMFKEFADVQTADMLNLPMPKCNFKIEVTKPTTVQKQLMAEIAERADRIRNKNPKTIVKKNGETCDDNMILLTGAGRALSLSPKLVDPSLPDDEPGKIEQCTDNVARIYKETDAKRLTQVVFCDLGTPKDDKDAYTVYDTVKKELIEKGVKEDEIAFVHDCKTNEQKLALFKRVRKGEVRVILGSSDKLGVGSNIQDRMFVQHDLDCPWKPSQVEQRKGRTVRQDNINDEVFIYRYVTENTFDTYLWQTNENKQRFISQIMTSKTPCREATDIDETMLDYSTTKCICTGNPKFKEKMELERDLEILKADRAQYLDTHEMLGKRLATKYPQEIQSYTSMRDSYAKDATILAQHKDEDTMTLEDKTYTGKEEIGKTLEKFAKDIVEGKLDHSPKGSFQGLKFAIVYDKESYKPVVRIGNFHSMTIPIGKTTAATNADRLFNIHYNFNSQVSHYQEELDAVQKNYEQDKELYEQPFEKETELQEKTQRYIEVSEEIDATTNSELKEEINKRFNQVTGLTDVNEPSPADNFYIELARKALMTNRNEWDEKFDSNIATAMIQQGFSQDDTQKAIYRLSPSVPDKGKAARLVGIQPIAGKSSFSR